ncbi:MAG: type VI secretion system baseplate subunit TssF [bacterium]|nr:type VI secretion system baseplate subunit TssF [bacterium]
MPQRFEDYYANELQYLTDAGKAFAQRHSTQNELLNLDNVEVRDPNVERLFQNFAFLTSGIRRRLDDELPEISDSLLGLLAPQYLRPIPSIATIQLCPDFAQLGSVQTIKRDANVQSDTVRVADLDAEIAFKFRTCYPVTLYPLELTDVRQLSASEAGGDIELTFERRGPSQWSEFELDRIRLFLRGDSARQVYSLHHYLTQKVTSIEIDAPGAPEGGSLRIEPVGFERDQEVIPYDVYSFPGHRLLQEYFCCPEKFLYVDITGLEEQLRRLSDSVFRLRIGFEGGAPPWWSLSKRSFRQFCTPAINLFEDHAYPIDFDQRTTEYPILPSKSSPSAWQVHTVRSVSGRPRGKKEAKGRSYPPLFDFRQKAGQASAYYSMIRRRDASDEFETLLSLVQPDDAAEVLPEQVLSIEVDAFNGDYARLAKGETWFRGDGLTMLVRSVECVTPPSRVRWPPLGGESIWHLVSHLAANQISMTDPKAMAGAMRLYDWTEEGANSDRIEGLVGLACEPEPSIIFRQGIAIRGLDLNARLEGKNFSEIGDAHLFALVLRDFLALYATVNSFVHLHVTCQPVDESGKAEEWSWPPMDGLQQPL